MAEEGVTSRRAEYALLTRAAILDAATRLFVEQGYAATGLDEVGRLARVSKGAVYHHFTDKPGLFAEVFETHCTSALGVIEQSMRPSMSTREVIVTAISSMLSAYAKDPQLRELSRQAGFAIGEDRRRQIQQNKSLPFVRQIFETAAQEDELRVGVDVDVAARMVLELVFDGAVAFAESPTKRGYRSTIERVLVAMVTGLLVPAEGDSSGGAP
ncbi:TetR/AcrR family transcriptional regulator [Gordonia sp. TBRC 11910]|uniref:TetR/AcrR family transcriptional regulator n=1 Tax=Gordonia asplenii TaxID=2725283 RepID=A0A848KTF3_9ACTN|nr:TetR/AcrR family transcriptional regulator [Gordonia asplenii]NMO01760.1 TetR/AcrR family transcriptional regulator [Gordonia asplenii]